jgi:hypothetical protein
VIGVDFSQNPSSETSSVSQSSSSSTRKQQIKQTYADYIFSKHGRKLHQLDQPLLIALPQRKTFGEPQEEVVYLVAELCLMTGIEESVSSSPSKYQLMREVVNATAPSM